MDVFVYPLHTHVDAGISELVEKTDQETILGESGFSPECRVL